MKKQSKLRMLGAGFAMALGALIGGAQASQPIAQDTQKQSHSGQSSEIKGEKLRRESDRGIRINSYGGLDFDPIFYPQTGLTPKEYGIRYGNGKSRIKKSNRLRFGK